MPKIKSLKTPFIPKRLETKNYWKIFSFNYLETFNDFIESILKYEKITSTESGQICKTKISLQIEKSLFKFLFLDQKLKIRKNSQINLINQTQTKSTAVIKKRMVLNCSKYFEFCFKHNFISKNFTEMNKTIFYYLINFYDISSRKTYQYFNIYTILYFILNKHIDDGFKRFIVSRFLVNMDLLKFNHFLIFLNEIYKNENESQENLRNLFHPFNPFNINSEILENFFSSSKTNEENSYSEILSARDLIQIVNLPRQFPFKQKIVLIENLIQKLDENYLKSLSTKELLQFIKALKIVESEFSIASNYYQNFNRIKLLIQNLKIKAEIKLKFHFKKSSLEYFYSNIPKFLNLIQEIAVCGKYIDDKEIFEEFFILIRKSAMKNASLNSVINSLFEIFIELHPNFVFKLFVEDWKEKIFRDENLGRILKNVLKSVLFYSLKFDNSENEKIKNFGIFKDFVKNLYFDPKELSQAKINCSINDLIEICFYMILIHELKFVTFEESELDTNLKLTEKDKKVFVEFLKIQIKKIFKFLYGNLELNMNIEKFVDEISAMVEDKNVNENKEQFANNESNFNFDLLNISENYENAVDYLYMICNYLSVKKSEDPEFINLFEDEEINYGKIKIMGQELKNYKIREKNKHLFTYNSSKHSFTMSDEKIYRELRNIRKIFFDLNFHDIEFNSGNYVTSEILEYSNGYYEIKIERLNPDKHLETTQEKFLYVSYTMKANPEISKELKEIFLEKFMNLIVNRKNAYFVPIDYHKWINFNKEEKSNLIKNILLNKLVI